MIFVRSSCSSRLTFSLANIDSVIFECSALNELTSVPFTIILDLV